MKTKVIGIVVARNTSSRFPRKHLKKIGNKTMLEILFDRLKKVENLNEIILSTTTNDSDNMLIDLAKKNKINFYRGSENNVTKRVIDTASKFNAQIILLVTGDCPIFDYNLASQLLKTFLVNKNLDYANNGQFGLPNGMGCQVFKMNSLKNSFKNIRWKDEYEHVTLNLRRNKKKFNHLYVHADKLNYAPKLMVTLDEQLDFIVIKKIINFFKLKNNKFFLNQDIIKNKKALTKIFKINSKIKRNDDIIKLSYK